MSRLLTLIAFIYVVALVIFLILRPFLVDESSFFALLNSLTHLLFAPALLSLLLAIFTRSRALAAAFLLPAVLFSILYGKLFLPRSNHPTAEGSPRLSVMTFNLGPNVSEPADVVQAIQAENADIIAVQELIPETTRLLNQNLAQRYPYRILNPNYETTGLMSRYRIVQSEWFRPAGEGRPAIHAVLDVNGTPWHFFAVHPYPSGIRWWKPVDGYPLPVGLETNVPERDISYLAQRVPSYQGPVLVLGDFNMTDQTHAYAELAAVLNDAFVDAGWGLGLTFPFSLQAEKIPVRGPFVRLDYIFYSSHLTADEARVTCKGGSDHCYVFARLAYTPKR